ncbi:ATP-binding cassette domain-containing protein [Phosphitispora sp. TUW77]|uniref:ATP-binding cassette domain-containing protein n=1 Tax=Phosphitispora sp. TUW77 TaxID=3152361 RepID=UPI003AB4703F
MNAIEISDLRYTYADSTVALKGISLVVKKGARAALLGPNGAGKSTLLMHLNGINLPQQGSVNIFSRMVNKVTAPEIRRQVGLVFQDPDDQVFSTSVWDDVAFGPLNIGLSRHEIERRVTDALKMVGMWELREKVPHHLSFGQKKRVAIAGVLAMDPEVIVLDEPTAYLDPGGQEVLMAILRDFHNRGKTLIVATHDMDMAAEWSDSVIIIKDGATLAHGGTELLGDISLMREANLRLPIVSQVFSHFDRFMGKALPKTVAEAVSVLEGYLK